MRGKMISAVYGILSVAVWAGTMALIAFMIFLFCTGQNRQPTFSVNAVRLSAASADDPALCGHTQERDGWYKAEYSVTVEGAKLSPFTYTVNNVTFNAPSDVQYAADWFVTDSGDIEYSKLSPDDFTVTLYLRCGDVEQARDIAMRSGFGFRGVKQTFAFFTKELVMNQPGFSISDFQITPEIADNVNAAS